MPANRTDLNAWPSGAAVAGISVASTHPMLARPQLGQEQEGAREGGTAEVTADFFHPDKWRARHFLPKERGGDAGRVPSIVLANARMPRRCLSGTCRGELDGREGTTARRKTVESMKESRAPCQSDREFFFHFSRAFYVLSFLSEVIATLVFFLAIILHLVGMVVCRARVRDDLQIELAYVEYVEILPPCAIKLFEN